MISVERLSLSLPVGFEARAANIAHELAAALTRLEPAASKTLGRLLVPRVSIVASASDAAIARDIAAAIERCLGASRGPA